MIRLLKIILIFILSIVTIGTVIFLTLVLTKKIDVKDFNFSFGITHSKKVVVDEEYENSFNKISIKTEAGDIEIKKSDNDKIRLVVYGSKSRTEVSKDSESLNVVTKSKKCRGFCLNQKIDKVIVYLPSEYSNPVNIKTNYGDIKINEVNSLTANTNYGDIKIASVNNYFRVNTNYGDIKISKLDINKDSSASTNFGDIKIGDTNDIYIQAKTDLGDKDINSNNKKSNITLKLNTNLGDIEVNN